MTQKNLYRSTENRVIAGVCGGLGEYFDVDPAVIRILWALFVFAGGAGIWAYIIAWIIIPESATERVAKPVAQTLKPKKPNDEEWTAGRVWFFGYGLILLGVLFMINSFLPSFGIEKFWPLILIGIGGIIIFSSKRSV